MTRVLVCGGRLYGRSSSPEDDERAETQRIRLKEVLDRFHAEEGPIDLLIQGGAKGADTLAEDWASSVGVLVEEYMAEWGVNGRAAGAIRNATMLELGRPDVVIAFPGGPGTADMVRQAKRAGVRVIEVPGEGSDR